MKINELGKMLNISCANIRFYEKEGNSCPVWCSDNKEVWCLLGSGHTAVDINSILEDL